MIQKFSIKALEDTVEPYDLIDVLDSLMENEYIEGYYFNWETDQVEIDVPRHVEIAEILQGFEELRESKSKPKRETH